MGGAPFELTLGNVDDPIFGTIDAVVLADVV